MGVHHAREWPAGELTMEWALRAGQGLQGRRRARDDIVRAAATSSCRSSTPTASTPPAPRALAGPRGGRDESVDDTAYIVAGASTGGEYRRKNCRLPDDSAAGNCTTSAGLAENGVDPNRNYGGLWGGPGADATNAFAQTYRGPAPFSEPESRNVRRPRRRQPGDDADHQPHHRGARAARARPRGVGDPVDENRGYKALGDAMAKENGYFSQKSFELYDTTGTTEDWSYNATGGFGFTFELYCGAPNYATGDCDDPAFHPLLPARRGGVGRHQPGGRPRQRPRPGQELRRQGQPRGLLHRRRERAQHRAPQRPGGQGPAGHALRLTKKFKTDTFPQPQPDGSMKPIQFDDSLETVYDVGETAPSAGT